MRHQHCHHTPAEVISRTVSAAQVGLLWHHQQVWNQCVTSRQVSYNSKLSLDYHNIILKMATRWKHYLRTNSTVWMLPIFQNSDQQSLKLQITFLPLLLRHPLRQHCTAYAMSSYIKPVLKQKCSDQSPPVGAILFKLLPFSLPCCHCALMC